MCVGGGEGSVCGVCSVNVCGFWMPVCGGGGGGICGVVWCVGVGVGVRVCVCVCARVSMMGV